MSGLVKSVSGVETPDGWICALSLLTIGTGSGVVDAGVGVTDAGAAGVDGEAGVIDAGAGATDAGAGVAGVDAGATAGRAEGVEFGGGCAKATTEAAATANMTIVLFIPKPRPVQRPCQADPGCTALTRC